MDDISNLIEILNRDPTGEEIADTLLGLLTDADEELRLLVLVKLREAHKEQRFTLSSPVPLTESERVVKEMVLDSGSLVTADQVVEMAPDYPRTLRHRSGASAILNTLVNRGELGKFTMGRESYFTSVAEAVRQAQIMWMREHPGQGPEHTDPTAVATITGLSSARVIRVLAELIGEKQ